MPRLRRLIDWLFAEVGGAVRGAVSNRELRRVLGVGLASALSIGGPHIAAVVAGVSSSPLRSALLNGFTTGVVGGAVSYLHRKYDGTASGWGDPNANAGGPPLPPGYVSPVDATPANVPMGLPKR